MTGWAAPPTDGSACAPGIAPITIKLHRAAATRTSPSVATSPACDVGARVAAGGAIVLISVVIFALAVLLKRFFYKGALPRFPQLDCYSTLTRTRLAW